MFCVQSISPATFLFHFHLLIDVSTHFSLIILLCLFIVESTSLFLFHFHTHTLSQPFVFLCHPKNRFWLYINLASFIPREHGILPLKFSCISSAVKQVLDNKQTKHQEELTIKYRRKILSSNIEEKSISKTNNTLTMGI